MKKSHRFLKENKKKLPGSEENYRFFLEQMPAVTYIAAPDYKTTTFVSPQIERLVGYSQADFLADSNLWKRRLHPDDRERVLSELRRCEEFQDHLVIEYRILTSNDKVIWFHDEAVLIRDRENAPQFIFGVVFDITDKKLTEEMVKESEGRFRQLAENIDRVFWLTPPDKNEMLYVSPSYEKVWGRTCASLYENPRSFLDPIHPQDQRYIIHAQKKQIEGTYNETYRIILPDGSVRWIKDRAFPVRNEHGEIYRIAGIAEDITEQKEFEEEISNYQKRLQSLASELSLAEERERRRLSQGLHDHIGQALAMSKIKLGALMASLLHSSEIYTRLEEIRFLIDRSIESVRSLTFEISPPILYELGLEPALEWLSEKFQGDNGISIEFESDHEPRAIKQDVQILIFQVTRELLINVVKHSRANKVKVSVRTVRNCIQIDVVDDGLGFDTSENSLNWKTIRGYGLFSVRERLVSLGGEFVVTSKPNEGTHITIAVPIPTSTER